METLKFWARPAIIAGLWIALASFTLAELTTVVPSLRSAPAAEPAPRLREARQRPVFRTRTQSASRAAVTP